MDNNQNPKCDKPADALNLDSDQSINADPIEADFDMIFTFDNNNAVVDPKITALASGGCCTCTK